ncbi:MAG: threonine aldolase, partial [Lachnospiraceae bacterium]|nr:threonine aldolase [Lachnospiraceae bacterium]
MIPVTYRVGEDGSPDFEFFERTLDTEEIRLVTLENTHNFSGGTCMSLEAMKQIRSMTSERGIPIHMDGARIFNASLTLGV